MCFPHYEIYFNIFNITIVIVSETQNTSLVSRVIPDFKIDVLRLNPVFITRLCDPAEII